MFAGALRDGELDFLAGRRLAIRVEDLGIAFCLSREPEGLRVGPHREDADLHIGGGVHEYLLLVSRREDADTLFFQRRLHMSGDTELGLYVKNFLDALDPETQPLQGVIEHLAGGALVVHERLFGHHPRS